MNDKTNQAIKGDRIAKVLARSGLSSRREAETIIQAGRVTVNGKSINSPALNVLPSDRITVDGKEIIDKKHEKGKAVKLERVIMERGTYPREWKSK
mgnify:CR=1 FL=1